MDVLHINCNYITTALHQTMIEHLDSLGVLNKVFVPTYNPENAVIKPNDDVCVAKCFRKWDRLIFDYKQSKIIKCIQKEYNIKDFDCIHAYTLFTDGNCAMKLSKNYGIPYVVAVRSTDVNTFLKYMPYLRKRAIQIMQGASAIFFLSESYRSFVFGKYVPQEYKVELIKKSYVIPNGIDDFWFKNMYTGSKRDSINRIKNKELRVIYAGRIIKNKNIVLTQKALQILRDRGWKVSFTVVGKVYDESEFNNIMQYPNTIYYEQQTKEKLIELYRANDIFIMPSHTETFGLVYAEAISQCLPVIYTKGQGFDSQFPEGVVGFHVDSHSVESLLDTILKIIANYENIISDLPEKSRKYSWDVICRLYIQIYNEISQSKT